MKGDTVTIWKANFTHLIDDLTSMFIFCGNQIKPRVCTVLLQSEGKKPLISISEQETVQLILFFLIWISVGATGESLVIPMGPLLDFRTVWVTRDNAHDLSSRLRIMMSSEILTILLMCWLKHCWHCFIVHVATKKNWVEGKNDKFHLFVCA